MHLTRPLANCHSRQIFGLIACLERFLADADDRGNNFLVGLLEKQHTRLKGLLDRHVVSGIIPCFLMWD